MIIHEWSSHGSTTVTTTHALSCCWRISGNARLYTDCGKRMVCCIAYFDCQPSLLEYAIGYRAVPIDPPGRASDATVLALTARAFNVAICLSDRQVPVEGFCMILLLYTPRGPLALLSSASSPAVSPAR